MERKEPVVKYLSFFPSYKEAIDILPDDSQKLAAYEMIINYGLYGVEPDYDSVPYNLKLLFITIRANIEASVKNIQNGSKGGRPPKNNNKKTPVNTPLKTPVNTKKEKEKKKEKEMENIPFTSSYGETLPPSAGAGGASPFTLTDCEECADEGKVNLSEDGIRAFYNRMEKDGWEIKGTPVTNLLKAMRGFAKHHKEYQQPEEEKPDSEDEAVSEPEREKTVEDYMRQYEILGDEEQLEDEEEDEC